MPPRMAFLDFWRKPPEAEGHEIPDAAKPRDKNKKLGVLLGFFLGFFGIHVLAIHIARVEVSSGS
jgi:hypothetical protein